MTCPLCKGEKVIRRTHAHPQNTLKEDVCPVCHGSGEVEIINIENKPIEIYYTDYSLEPYEHAQPVACQVVTL